MGSGGFVGCSCNFVELLECVLAGKIDANANIYNRLCSLGCSMHGVRLGRAILGNLFVYLII